MGGRLAYATKTLAWFGVVRREILDVFHSSLWVEGLHMRQKSFPLEEHDLVLVAAVGLFYCILYCLRVVRREILDVFHGTLWVERLAYATFYAEPYGWKA